MLGENAMNNLKLIREVYGITQEEIAKAINVNRATVSSWENNDSRRASNSSLEKLSLFYGIGPEYFYEEVLNDTVKGMLIDNAKRQKELEEKSVGQPTKAEAFNEMFTSITFDEAVEQYMIAMKMMLATADSGSIKKLETVLLINQKMGTRLKSVLDIRKEEEEGEEISLGKLLDSLSDED